MVYSLERVGLGSLVTGIVFDSLQYSPGTLMTSVCCTSAVLLKKAMTLSNDLWSLAFTFSVKTSVLILNPYIVHLQKSPAELMRLKELYADLFLCGIVLFMYISAV